MRAVFPVILLAVVAAACSQTRRLESVKAGVVGPALMLSEDPPVKQIVVESCREQKERTGAEDGVFVMKAERTEDGEMVVTDVLDAAITVSTFRNLAERNGVVELRFDIVAPASLLDSRWQLRFAPELLLLKDTLRLDPVYVTGEAFRKSQLKGYGRYVRFEKSIITDSSAFVSKRELEIFLSRYGTDGYSSAVDHYTDKLRRAENERRASLRADRFRKYVKNPIVSEGIRLDTVVGLSSGDVRFSYVHTMEVRDGMKKAVLFLGGELRSEAGPLCEIPKVGPLTFYISSLGTLADGSIALPDSLYREGLMAVRQHRFRDALPLLVPYSDYNTALAYTALDYNARALEILEKCPENAMVNYLKAILYSRGGDEKRAVGCYLAACGQDGSFVHRGNLDPEISVLKKKMNLNLP